MPPRRVVFLSFILFCIGIIMQAARIGVNDVMRVVTQMEGGRCSSDPGYLC